MKVVLVLMVLCSCLWAVPNYVDSLNKRERAQLDSVQRAFVFKNGKALYQVLNDTVYGTRFNNFAAWYCTNDRELDYILDKLRKREQTFFPEAKDSFFVAPSSTTVAGAGAPFEIVAYITSTCPHCKKVGIPLYDMVTEGELKGKAAFSIKPIHKKIGDFALLSADRQGKMWDLFIALGDIKKYLDEEQLLVAVEKAGLDMGALTNDIEKNADKNEEQISANYAECKRNELEYTPTLYVNGVRYRSNKRPVWIQDYIEFLCASQEK